IGPKFDSIPAGLERLRGAVCEDDMFALIEKKDCRRAMVQPLRCELLHRTQGAEPECDPQRPFDVTMKVGKPFDVFRLVPPGVPRTVEGNPRLYGWHQARLANHTKAGVNVPLVPVVVRMVVF